MIDTANNSPRMPERFGRLIRRSLVCAVVMGRGEETKLFYLTEDCDAEIIEAAKCGFINAGLLGYCDGRILTEPDRPGEECARFLKLASSDFLTAIIVLKAGKHRTTN